MKKIISILLLSFFLISNCFAWGNFLQQKAEKIVNNFSKKIQNDPASKKNELTIYENVAETIYRIINKGTLKKNQKELLVFILEELNEKINLFDEYYYNLNWKNFIWWGNEPFWSIEINWNTIFFTDYNATNPKKEIYRVIATKSQEEITLDTAIWPFFVLKEQECIDDMNEKKYNYSIFVYVWWVEKFTGCINEKK